MVGASLTNLAYNQHRALSSKKVRHTAQRRAPGDTHGAFHPGIPRMAQRCERAQHTAGVAALLRCAVVKEIIEPAVA